MDKDVIREFRKVVRGALAFLVAGTLVIGALVWLGGCAQNTETPVVTDAQTATDTGLAQVSDALGNATRQNPPRSVFIGVVNNLRIYAPVSNDADVPSGLALAAPDESPLALGVEGAESPHHMTIGDLTITFTQSTTVSADQESAQAGEQAPAVSVAQTPTVTSSPTQTVKPAIAIDAPVGLWGGIAQGAANVAQEQSTATQDNAPTATAKWMQILGALGEAAQDPAFWDMLDSFMNPASGEEAETPTSPGGSGDG